MKALNLPVIVAMSCILFGCSTAVSNDLPSEAAAPAPAAPAPKTIASMDCKELDEKMASVYRSVSEFEASMPKTPPQGKTMADVKKANAESKTLYVDPLVKEYSATQKEYKGRCKGEPSTVKVAKKQYRTTFIR